MTVGAHRMFTCPVCGYPKLERPPANYSICPCCGTEFDYDDRVLTHGQLTYEWIAKGCPWFDSDEPKPEGWNEWNQLIAADLGGYVPKFVSDIHMQADVTVGVNIQLGSLTYELGPYQAQAA